MSIFALAAAYIIGGVTFIPLTLGAVLLHAHFTFPRFDSSSTVSHEVTKSLDEENDDSKNIVSGPEAIAKRLEFDDGKDVAEGYFAVCREYVPGGVNGKPPVRTTPAGSVVAEESPSVYQSMYRSLFERKQVNSLDTSKNEGGKSVKRARNVFYVVLRHGHLMLYDDSEQVEVRHVISLAHHDVGIYGGGNEIPESELWIKRNAISLRRRAATQDQGSSTLPFFFFSENCSEKEDFYFALLRSQDRDGNENQAPPKVQYFEVKDIISLVQRLHSTEEHLQTRWINALVGRLFLALYKTQTAEDFIRMKITKKIARVKKPTFLSGIILNKISLGTSAPFITNPRLRDLTVEGEYCAEAHVKYEGNFRIEIAATARIDLGPRFKAREVNLVLAVVVKKLEGQLLVRLKPPPSNRLWIAFEAMPQLELSIEPIVSSRQITYSVILRAIESRIREVLAETIVLPHWDDSPFLDTAQELFRGGIWAMDNSRPLEDHETAIPDEMVEDDTESGSIKDGSPTLKPLAEDRSASMPALVESIPEASISRRGHKATSSLIEPQDTSISSSIQRTPEVPKVMRSKSFAAVADPVVNTNSVNSSAKDPSNKRPRPSKDAASFMTEISHRSHPSSPVSNPAGIVNSGYIDPLEKEKRDDGFSTSPAQSTFVGAMSTSKDIPQAYEKQPNNGFGDRRMRSNSNNNTSNTTQPSRLQAVAKSLTPSAQKQQAMLSAATAAKNWGWSTLNRKTKRPDYTADGERAGTPENPMGRGRPLPPPGQPLPPPEKKSSVTSFTLPKRKPVPSTSLQSLQSGGKDPGPSPVTPRGYRRQRSITESESEPGALLVVEAPDDGVSGGSVEDDDADGYGEFMDNVNIDDEKDESTEVNQPKTPTDFEIAESDKEMPAQLLVQSGSVSLPSSLEDSHGLQSWHVAQEEEARSKSIWMDEQEHS